MAWAGVPSGLAGARRAVGTQVTSVRTWSATGRERPLIDENRRKASPQVGPTFGSLTRRAVRQHKRLLIRGLWVRVPRGPPVFVQVRASEIQEAGHSSFRRSANGPQRNRSTTCGPW